MTIWEASVTIGKFDRDNGSCSAQVDSRPPPAAPSNRARSWASKCATGCTLFHIPLAESGLLLAVWAVASLCILGYEMRRHGLGRETLAYVPLLLLVGGVVAFVLPAIAIPRGCRFAATA